MDQLDGLQERGDFVQFDKEIAEMDTLLSQAPTHRYFRLRHSAQEDMHLKMYYMFMKSYDKSSESKTSSPMR